MSSISNEGRRDNTVQKLKEEYTNREIENNRKHREAIKDITEMFQHEIEGIKESNSEKMDDMQKYMRGRLTKQEQEHQDQIQEMREVFAQQIRKRKEESQSAIKNRDAAHELAITKQKDTYETQKHRLENQYDVDTKKKEEMFTNYVKNSREENQKNWENRRSHLQRSAENQLNSERMTSSNQMAELQRKLGEVQSNNELELSQVKKNSEYEKDRISEAHRQNLEVEERRNTAIHESMTNEAREQQKLVKEKYRDELELKKQEVVDEKEEFKDRVNERVNDEVRGLKMALKNEKEDRAIEKSSLNKQSQIERRNLISEYEKRLADERQQKKDMLEKKNVDVGGEIDKAVRSRDILIKNQAEEKLRERELQKSQYKAQVAQINNAKDIFQEDIKRKTEEQLDRTKKTYQDSSKKELKQYEETVDAVKKDYINALNEERIRHIEERADIENRLEKKVRERERDLGQEMDRKIFAYENRIQDEKDLFRETLLKKEEEFKIQLQNRERAQKDALKMVEMKYQNQMEQMKETFESDLELRERRHQTEMNELARKINSRQK